MRSKMQKRAIATAVCLGLSGAAATSYASTITVNFDTPGQLASQFNNFTATGATPASTNPFSDSTTGGVNNSGSVAVNAIAGTDGTATYKGQGFDFSQVGETITETLIFDTTSSFTAANTVVNGRILQFGFLTTTSGGYNGNPNQTGGATPFPAFASVRLSDNVAGTGTTTEPVYFQGQQKVVGTAATGAVSTANGTVFNIIASEYYELTVVATQNGGGNYTMTGSLQDMGTTGTTVTGSPTTYTAPGTTALPDVATTVYGGFRESGQSGAINYDVFTISGTPIPEPASIGLVGLTSLGLLARRRRQA